MNQAYPNANGMKIFTGEAGSPEEDLGCWEELDSADGWYSVSKEEDAGRMRLVIG